MAPADFDTQDFWLNPTVGSGPFKFVRYETDQFIELARNDDYYMGAPHLDKVIISIVTPATMVAQLEKGEVDISAAGGIGDIPLDDWERVQALPNVTAYELPGQRLSVHDHQRRPGQAVGRQARPPGIGLWHQPPADRRFTAQGPGRGQQRSYRAGHLLLQPRDRRPVPV